MYKQYKRLAFQFSTVVKVAYFFPERFRLERVLDPFVCNSPTLKKIHFQDITLDTPLREAYMNIFNPEPQNQEGEKDETMTVETTK